MSLSRAQIVEAGQELLTRHGLGGLTMRQLAKHLGVQPGALYYHVESKQDLLVGIAERILEQSETAISADDPIQAAIDIRSALLPIRDSAEVVSFVNAFRPAALTPFHALEDLFAGQLPAQQAHWAATTLIHYVLGFVAQEQNQAELVRARISTDADESNAPEDAFRFGAEAIVRGLPSSATDARGVDSRQRPFG